jgi:hypothetical protein
MPDQVVRYGVDLIRAASYSESINVYIVILIHSCIDKNNFRALMADRISPPAKQPLLDRIAYLMMKPRSCGDDTTVSHLPARDPECELIQEVGAGYDPKSGSSSRAAVVIRSRRCDPDGATVDPSPILDSRTSSRIDSDLGYLGRRL